MAMVMSQASVEVAAATPACSSAASAGRRCCRLGVQPVAAAAAQSLPARRVASLRRRGAAVMRTWRSSGARLRVVAEAAAAEVPAGAVSIVLLSGGVGKRMGASIPKQYLELHDRPIATWSLETFLGMREVGEVVIVCDPSWKHIFEEALARMSADKPIKFALPGAERQDSMTNGFKEIRSGAELVAIHDSARPLVTAAECLDCFKDALATGAAVLGVPVKPTIKEVGDDGLVVKTLQRSALWEVQTPQVIQPALLQEGVDMVAETGIEVTDDVSIIEALGKPVQITRGQYTNIKVTTPDDMSVAERFLEERAAAVA